MHRALAVLAVVVLASVATASALDSLVPKYVEFAAKHKEALDKVGAPEPQLAHAVLLGAHRGSALFDRGGCGVLAEARAPA